MTDRTFTQAEVDARIAAAYERCAIHLTTVLCEHGDVNFVAQVFVEWSKEGDAQKALDDRIATERALFAQKAAEHQIFAIDSIWYQCTCGAKFHWQEIDGVPKPNPVWRDHILALTDQNLLQEHDAALRSNWDAEETSAYDELIDNLRAQKAKLEAENAGLRECAWLAERLDSAEGPEYVTVSDIGMFEFTKDPNKAIRFKRMEDARQMAGLFELEDVRAREHSWPEVAAGPEGRK